jgi:hypothetical protein
MKVPTSGDRLRGRGAVCTRDERSVVSPRLMFHCQPVESRSVLSAQSIIHRVMVMAKVQQYRVHGLQIASEIALPELLPDFHQRPIDVRIRLGSIQVDQAEAATGVAGLFVDHDTFILVIPEVARFAITGNTEVTIEPGSGADMALVRLFLFGSVMGLICHQRRLLPLHASAVAVGDTAIAFSGPPGAGKSTLAAHCVDAGARLVTDDILIVSVNSPGCVLAQPGMPKLKLWRDALESLGRSTTGLVPDWVRAEKFHVPSDHLFVEHPVRLAGIFMLDNDDEAGAGILTSLSGTQAAWELIRNTYRVEYLDALSRRSGHFAECVRLAGQLHVAKLARRRDKGQLKAAAAVLVNQLAAIPKEPGLSVQFSQMTFSPRS